MKILEQHIFLVGFMGTGKSIVANELSKTFDIDELDTDQLIEKRENRNIKTIFEEDGEEYFRRCETELLKELIGVSPSVISCGGGMAVREENVLYMKEAGIVVLLTASPETIFKRVQHNHHRPLLNQNMNVDYITKLMKKREPFYQKAADYIIQTDGKSPAEIVGEIEYML